MLIKFECENHKSIKDKIVFSMEASKDNAHKESIIEEECEKIEESEKSDL